MEESSPFFLLFSIVLFFCYCLFLKSARTRSSFGNGPKVLFGNAQLLILHINIKPQPPHLPNHRHHIHQPSETTFTKPQTPHSPNMPKISEFGSVSVDGFCGKVLCDYSNKDGYLDRIRLCVFSSIRTREPERRKWNS